ncbi:MAG: hypothetical protein V1792_06990 [Pseudomonadota bacterium]
MLKIFPATAAVFVEYRQIVQAQSQPGRTTGTGVPPSGTSAFVSSGSLRDLRSFNHV